MDVWICRCADVATGKMRRKMWIIHEICMWLNGYFTSSAVVIVRRCPCLPPLPSSAIVLVVHHHLSVCQKSAPPYFTHYIHRFPPQNLSATYLLQHPHICILPLPSRTGTLAEPKCHRSIVSISRHLRATVGVTTRLRNDLY